jgi:indole-3-glycerol phosphate synthase
VLLETFVAFVLFRAGAILASGAGGQGQVLLGLNSRDLRSLEVDPGRLLALADRFPNGWPRVAESGLSEPGHAAAMASAGYDAGLVGTALMRAAVPDELIRSMREAGTAARMNAA